MSSNDHHGADTERFVSVGFHVCAWKMCSALFSASAAMGTEVGMELGPYPEALESHLGNAKRYDEELMRQYCALRVFLHSEDLATVRVLEGLKERFHNEVHQVIELLKSERSDASIKAALHKIHQSCEEIVEADERMLVPLIESVYKEMCMHCVTTVNPPIKEMRVVVSVDLAEYGRMTDEIEGFLGAEGIFAFNRQIQEIMAEVLNKQSISCEILINTGDGVLAVLREPDQAVEFAVAIHKAIRAKNAEKSNAEHRIHFRIGISTGNLVIQTTKSRDNSLAKHDIGGKVIKTAVRLQSAAQAGQVLICDKTHSLMKGDTKPDFGTKPRKIQGKPHEEQRIKAWCYSVYTVFRKRRRKRLSSAKRGKRLRSVGNHRKKSKGRKGKSRT
jgi:class 3 adenylate cyclase